MQLVRKMPNIGPLAVPLGIVGIIMLLVIPVNPTLLDALIIINLLGALTILMLTIFVSRPLDFSTFPSILLVMTMFRLGLSVASTRLILTEAHAGKVIEAFGQVTVAGNMVVGLVIFVILAIIGFLVVTKGAERVAQVGARFTLDSMPGKQSAIDVEMAQGMITEVEAKRRRGEVVAEADFYGAMDGASSFVKGDAIVSIIVVVVNLLAGVVVGIMFHGMKAMESLETFALLTVGDGLVTQIPALLMSVATGMIVTRSSNGQDLGTSAADELTSSPKALLIPGIAALGLGLIPGMPLILFWILGLGLIFGARFVAKNQKAKEVATALAEATPETNPILDTQDQMIDDMRVTPLSLHLSMDIASEGDLVDDLLSRVKGMRKKVAAELGVLMPQVRTRDDLELPESTYTLQVNGVEVARGLVPANAFFAYGGNLDAVPGTPGVEPVYGMEGKWVPMEHRYTAGLNGATVWDRGTVVATHLADVAEQYASQLLSREDVRQLTDRLKKASPSTVDELVPSLLTLAEVQRVLQGLLVERVPINNLSGIFEAITLRAKESTAPEGLIEAARHAVAPMIALSHSQAGTLSHITIDPLLEQEMVNGLRPGVQGTEIHLAANNLSAFTERVRAYGELAERQGSSLVLVCFPSLRPAMMRLLRQYRLWVPVLTYDELTSVPTLNLTTYGAVALETAHS